MMKLLDQTHNLYTKEQADDTAAMLNDTMDDGWEYTAIHDPAGTGYSFIEVRDEEGKFVGKM